MKNLIKLFLLSVCLFFASLRAMQDDLFFLPDEDIQDAEDFKQKALSLLNDHLKSADYSGHHLCPQQPSVDDFRIYQSDDKAYLGFLFQCRSLITTNICLLLICKHDKFVVQSWAAYPNLNFGKNFNLQVQDAMDLFKLYPIG